MASIQDHPEATPRTWHIGFLSRPFSNWWDIFSPSWCRHVLAYGYVLQSDRWIVVDPAQDRTLVAVMTTHEFDDWLATVLIQDPIILRIPAGPGDSFTNRIFQTCSSIVARIAGLKGSAWRPMALIRMLKAQKAEIIYGPQHEREGETAEGRP